MSEDTTTSRLFPISGLLMLFAVLGVIFYQNVPFEGSRPPEPDISEQQQRVKVKARLWQDPFLAVLRDVNINNPQKTKSFCLYSSCKTNTLPQPLAEELKKKKGNVTVVGVMVFGAPHAEEGEMRIRKRYAALSAFHRLGFEPEDPEHIEYVRIVHEATNGNPGKPSMADIMPFEWLKRENGDDDSILLLWINDDVFQETPLSMLERLYNCFPKSQPLKGNSAKVSLVFKVIGPAGSTTLREMMREVRGRREPASNSKTVSPKLTIFSPTATVDDSILLRVFDNCNFAKDPSRSVESRFKNVGFPLHRMNCSDGELAEKIREELNRRGIDCRNSKNHVVLLTEWDTYYGRSQTEVYKRAFFQGGIVDFDRQIHTFSFMRGVDGKIPDEKESGEASGKKKEKNGDGKTTPATVKELEHATGMSQYDYIRRLADEIYSFEQQLDDGGSIRAIGVLGSDFHDKYLLLQALRQRFPQAVFFTTDLDARFLHPDTFQWTRNVIVASSFNLWLRNDDHINLQGDIPPFRDSSQTAIYYTILRSFDQGDYLDQKEQEALLQQINPRIFEIGRYRVVDLSEDIFDEKSFYPRPKEAKNNRKIAIKATYITILLFILLSFSSELVRDLMKIAFFNKSWGVRIATLAFLLLVALAVLAFYNCILLRPHLEEPLSFLEGVSVWPTEFLRIIAILLSLDVQVFLSYCHLHFSC